MTTKTPALKKTLTDELGNTYTLDQFGVEYLDVEGKQWTPAQWYNTNEQIVVEGVTLFAVFNAIGKVGRLHGYINGKKVN